MQQYNKYSVRAPWTLWITLGCVSLTLADVPTDNPLSVARHERNSERSRCLRLRERIAECLSEYAEVLVEELAFWSHVLEHDDCHSSKQSLVRSCINRRLRQLAAAEQFINTGTLDPIQTVIVSDKKITHYVAQLIRQLAQVQQALIHTLRCLVSGDTACCFVSTRAKSLLEGHMETAQRLIKESRETVLQRLISRDSI